MRFACFFHLFPALTWISSLPLRSLFLRSGDRGGQGAAHQALSDLHRLENDLEQAFQAPFRLDASCSVTFS